MEHRKALAVIIIVIIMYAAYKLARYIEKKEAEKLERDYKNKLHKKSLDS